MKRPLKTEVQRGIAIFNETCGGNIVVSYKGTPDERLICVKCESTWSDGRQPD